MRVLAFGTYDTRMHPRVQVILDGLRAGGDDVVEVNAPLGLDTAARVAILRNPWRLPLLAARLLAGWAKLVIGARRAVRGGRPDAVVVGYLGHFDVLLARALFPRSLFPHTTVVVDHLVFLGDTAVDRGVRDLRARLLAAVDTAALAAADLVVVDTTEHRDLVPAHHRHRAVVVPVGAPDWWFAPSPGAAQNGSEPDGPLRVVFFGLYTPLQGATVIAQAAALLADEPGVQWLMIGHGQQLEAARQAAAPNPHVQWLDWIDPHELPATVARQDVCLGIFGTTPKALRVVPNKVFQGAAAGCGIVTSDTPPQRRQLGAAARYVPAGDPVALAAALRELAGDRQQARALQTAARELAEQHFRPARVAAPLRRRLLPAGT